MPSDHHATQSTAIGSAEETVAVSAPQPGTASQEAAAGPKADSRSRMSWRRAKHWGRQAIAFATTLSTLLVAGWFVFLVGEATFRRNHIDLEAISVSDNLAKAGFSSPVVTRQLRDAVRGLQESARTTMRMTSVVVPQDLSGITMPNAGVSVEGIAGSIRGILPDGWRHEVSGEFTVSSDRLSLRLRLNGEIIFLDSATGPEAVNRLIKSGASKVVEKIQPYVIASGLYESDLDAAQAAADRIIASYPPGDENVVRAYNLKGLIAWKQKKMERAVAEFQTVIQMDANFPLAHNNLGLVWHDEGKTDAAIVEYQTAIRLGPKYAAPHVGLAIIWRDQGRTDDAIAEYKIAIRLDPRDTAAHNNLGNILQQQGKADAAIAEYRICIRLDPKDAVAHDNLGNIWRAQGKIDDAITEYQAAIRFDPKDAVAHNNLGNIWRVQGKADDAIAEYRTAIRLNPEYPAPRRSLGEIWKEQGDAGDALAEYEP